MASSNLAYANERREDREEVHYRTNAIGPHGPLSLLIVNISANGLMARCDAPVVPGDTLGVRLPNQPPVTAVVRWTLGGRIGCEFAATIAPAQYFAMLPTLSARR